MADGNRVGPHKKRFRCNSLRDDISSVNDCVRTMHDEVSTVTADVVNGKRDDCFERDNNSTREDAVPTKDDADSGDGSDRRKDADATHNDNVNSRRTGIAVLVETACAISGNDTTDVNLVRDDIRILINIKGTTPLMKAAYDRKTDLVKEIAKTYPEQLAKKNDYGWNALMFCCAGGSTEIFQYLVHEGLDPETTSDIGETCLMIAVHEDKRDLVEYLVHYYPEQLTSKDIEGFGVLLSCCAGGSVDMFQYLVQKGMDTATTSNTGQTCLMISAFKSNFTLVKHLVENYQEQLQSKDTDGANALLWCCTGGSIEIFEYLVEKGMDTRTTSNIGKTCMMIAANFNRSDLVKYLIENYQEQLPLKAKDGLNTLLCCCAGGSIKIFQYLVQKGMDTATTTNIGKTCMMIAAHCNRIDLVKCLGENYPEQLHLKDANGFNALLCCCAGGSVHLFQYLVQKGLDTATISNTGKTCLMIAVLNNKINLVQYLVKTHPEQLQLKDADGFNALSWCCAVGSVEIFQYLVQKGLDTATTSNTGKTCLMIAVLKTKTNLVKYLVENYPEQLPMRNKNGVNALLCSSAGGSVEIFQYLVQRGMDTATTTKKGQNCLMIAAMNNQTEHVKYLVENYPKQLPLKDENGYNALLWCCAGGSVEIFQYLMKKGMETNTTSDGGKTCLMIAALNNKIDLVKYLVENFQEQVSVWDRNGWNALFHSCASGSVEIFQYLVQIAGVKNKSSSFTYMVSMYLKTALMNEKDDYTVNLSQDAEDISEFPGNTPVPS
ncbi:putative ankyrin repeat protein RF_0381 [Pecten maximus]|uniref:putative ankyrin repeat protein RF_0381 n=1 Tax=Pecten maximus TaxID=6579 RepID=UPI0014589F7A|nr:putative ankyrin repeat protein RF_0381 [Pecten maximus]